ncbi:MAG: S-layer homology domain-containing protein, partial [Clostridia bacterium]|nr:S-layer homology domain-containing protein [Clostridia bacterium]
MYFKCFKKIGAGLMSAMLIFGTQAAIPVSAAADNIEIVLTDVTQDDQTTLLGEAKIKVSIKGAGGNVTAAQVALKFSGELKYKSIDFLQGKNNPPECLHIAPNAALANTTGKILPGIVTNNSGSLKLNDEETDLFVVTFTGEPGDRVELSLDNESAAGSYVNADNVFVETEEDASVSESATASDEDNEGVNAVVKLTMDKVDDFTVSTGEGYADSQILLTITNEETGSTISTRLNTVSNTKGGHYDSSSSIPTFIVETIVIGGDTYTVELSGKGYITKKLTGVDFSEAVELTNADFVPGDVNSDGKVDFADKTAFEEVKGGNYDNYEKDYADFNRDGKVDNYDDVFEGIEDEETPGNDGGSGDNSGNDGGSGDGGSGDSSGNGGNSGDNSGNGGNNSGNNGGSNGGGNTGFGGGAVVGGSTVAEAFTDLAGYDWAKESIYTLKNKGIISGVSETEYAPANNIKRGDFILILTRMLGISDAFADNFADVPTDSYYYNAIGSAKAAGIASGDGQNFMPENTITRQDLITLAYRAFLSKGYITETDDMTSLDAFADKDTISDYAKTAMASMV